MPLPDTPPQPGPGSYDVVDYEGAPKHYMSGAAFVSTTSRWTSQALKNSELPGPGKYMSQRTRSHISSWGVKNSYL